MIQKESHQPNFRAHMSGILHLRGLGRRRQAGFSGQQRVTSGKVRLRLMRGELAKDREALRRPRMDLGSFFWCVLGPILCAFFSRKGAPIDLAHLPA